MSSSVKRDHGEGRSISSSFYVDEADVSVKDNESGDAELKFTESNELRGNSSTKNKLSMDTPQNYFTKEKATPSSSSWFVLLYVPNLFGYLRILLSFYGFQAALEGQPNKALNLWIGAAVLDLLDGFAARLLNQCSNFGVLLDIIADNILRSIVWISAIIENEKHDGATTKRSCVWVSIIFIEWITMFCSQCKVNDNRSSHTHWKDIGKITDTERSRTPPPLLVRAVFNNNFSSIPGFFSIYGLFVAPLGSFVWYTETTWPKTLLSDQALSILILLSYLGRLLAVLVEMWICFDYFSEFEKEISHETKAKKV